LAFLDHLAVRPAVLFFSCIMIGWCLAEKKIRKNHRTESGRSHIGGWWQSGIELYPSDSRATSFPLPTRSTFVLTRPHNRICSTLRTHFFSNTAESAPQHIYSSKFNARDRIRNAPHLFELTPKPCLKVATAMMMATTHTPQVMAMYMTEPHYLEPVTDHQLPSDWYMDFFIDKTPPTSTSSATQFSGAGKPESHRQTHSQVLANLGLIALILRRWQT
jgi:hypothetical protein